MLKIKKISNTEVVYFMTVFAVILSSGANVLIRNIFILFFCCGMLLFQRAKVKRNHAFIAAFIMAYIFINSCITNTAPTDFKELLMMLVRLSCCVVVATFIGLDRFREYFLRIMVGLAIFSLFCFGAYQVFNTLPGLTTFEGGVGTFYHTVGHGSSVGEVARIRNCGIFGEPGLFQMYLNLAIIAILGETKASINKQKVWFWLLTITLITTFSSMGYLIYILVLILVYIKRTNILPQFITGGKSVRILLVCVLLAVGIIFEIGSGTVLRFIVETYSYASRHDDTIIAFLIARDYPIFGVGLATDILPIWDVYYERYSFFRLFTSYQSAMSNGLGNFAAMAGIPFTLVYFVCIIKAFCKLFGMELKIEKGIMAVILILIAFEEPYLSTPFFLISFFYSQTKIPKC